MQTKGFQRTDRRLFALVAAVSTVTAIGTAAPSTNVFPGAPNVSPNWDNLAAALADTDAGGTVIVAAGTYALAAGITITQPVTILGPQANVDPRGPSGLRTGGSPAEAGIDFSALTTLPALTVAASDVTINGLDLYTSNTVVQTGFVVSTDIATTRNNVQLSHNIFRRVNNTANINGINLQNTTASAARYNRITGFRGNDGCINVRASTGTVVSFNHISDTGNQDPSNGVQVWSTSAGATVTRNLFDGVMGKHGILLGDAGGATGGHYVADNDILDWDQAGIAVLTANNTIEFNRITNRNNVTVNMRAGIYLRDALMRDMTVRYNSIYNNAITSTTGGSVGSGMRLQAFATGQSHTLALAGNAYNKNNAAGPAKHGFGYDAAQTSTATCPGTAGGSVDIRNSWFGNSRGPGRRTVTGGFLNADTDACDGTTTTGPDNTYDSASTNNKATKRITFTPWALFAGDWGWIGTGGGSVTIPGSTAELTAPYRDLGNNRYFRHAVSVATVSQETRFAIWSPPNRRGVSNAMDVWMNANSAFTGGTVTVHYSTDTASFPNTDDTGGNEGAMQVVRWLGDLGAWDFLPTTLDTGLDTATASISSLSTAPTTFAALPNVVALPVVTNSGGSTNYAPASPAVTIDAGADADSNGGGGNLDSATVKIVGAPDGTNEVLAATPSGAILGGDIVYNAAANTLTITRIAPEADYDAVLASVTYVNNLATPTAGARTVEFRVSEVTGGIARASAASSKTVNIAGANTPPSVTVSGFNPLWTENGGPVNVDPGITVTDGDDTNLTSASMTLTNLADTGIEVLAAAAAGAITAGDIVWSAPTLTITANAPVADYQSVLQSLTYDNPTDNPTPGARVVEVYAFDGDDVSPVASKSIAIAPSNDNPSIVANTGGVVTRGASLLITNAMLAASDPDHGAADLTFTVATAPLHDAGFPASFTQADIDGNTISYDHDGSLAASDSFEFFVLDPLTGNSGTATFAITVNPPTATTDWTLHGD